MMYRVIERYAQKGETVTSIKPATSYVRVAGKLRRAYDGFLVNGKSFVAKYSLREYDKSEFAEIIQHD